MDASEKVSMFQGFKGFKRCGARDSARIAKTREILERAKRDIEGLDKA
jgi:hypothetical protein